MMIKMIIIITIIIIIIIIDLEKVICPNVQKHSNVQMFWLYSQPYKNVDRLKPGTDFFFFASQASQ